MNRLGFWLGLIGMSSRNESFLSFPPSLQDWGGPESTDGWCSTSETLTWLLLSLSHGLQILTRTFLAFSQLRIFLEAFDWISGKKQMLVDVTLFFMGCCSWWNLWFWSPSHRNVIVRLIDMGSYMSDGVNLTFIRKSAWMWFGKCHLVMVEGFHYSNTDGENSPHCLVLRHKPLSMRSDQDHPKTGTWLQPDSFSPELVTWTQWHRWRLA